MEDGVEQRLPRSRWPVGEWFSYIVYLLLVEYLFLILILFIRCIPDTNPKTSLALRGKMGPLHRQCWRWWRRMLMQMQQMQLMLMQTQSPLPGHCCCRLSGPENQRGQRLLPPHRPRSRPSQGADGARRARNGDRLGVNMNIHIYFPLSITRKEFLLLFSKKPVHILAFLVIDWLIDW